MRLISRFLRRSSEPQFVSARPGLTEFMLAFRYGTGFGRWLRLLWGVVSLPFRIVWRIVAWVLSLFGFAFAGSFRGLQQRRVRHLLQGLPALAALAAVVSIAAVAVSRRDTLANEYRKIAASRSSAKDWDAARLYYERLFRLEGGSADSRLLLGFTLAEMGDIDEARRLIEGVATGDAGGDPRANHWVASQMLSQPETWNDRDRLTEAGRHLLIAERGLPASAAIQLDLVSYYLAIGQPRAAVPKLAAAAVSQPALALDLARLYASLGEMASAKTELTRAVDHFRGAVERNPADRNTRLLLATAYVNLGRLDDAVATLRDGITIDPTGPYREMIARIHVSAYDRLAGQWPRNYPVMLATLRDALRYNPESTDAMERLVSFGEVRAITPETLTSAPDPEVDKAARELLHDLLAKGEPPAPVHMALGIKAWRAEDLETACWHFERAYDLDPTLAGVANNLAWVLAHQQEPDLDRALQTIDSVIERFPDVPHFRDTRGEIYRLLGRWDEALADLEWALPSMRKNPRIHQSLAMVYERLGKDEIAQKHRQEADRLQPPRQVTAAKLTEGMTLPMPEPSPPAALMRPATPHSPQIDPATEGTRQPVEALHFP